MCLSLFFSIALCSLSFLCFLLSCPRASSCFPVSFGLFLASSVFYYFLPFSACSCCFSCFHCHLVLALVLMSLSGAEVTRAKKKKNTKATKNWSSLFPGLLQYNVQDVTTLSLVPKCVHKGGEIRWWTTLRFWPASASFFATEAIDGQKIP